MIYNFDDLTQLITGRGKPKIYAFTTRTIPNYLKVGETCRPIKKRLDEWRLHYPNLTEEFSGDALVEDHKYYFRDYAVHDYLITEKDRQRITPSDVAPGVYFSNEFFKDATVDDVIEAISYIKHDYSGKGYRFQYYDINGVLKRDEEPKRDQTFEPRPNQQQAIDNFKNAAACGRKNLLMYAVMRFGKSFTSMCCAVEMDAKFVLIVTAKATVKKEWRDTIGRHVKFKDYVFIAAEDLDEDYRIISKTLAAGKRVAAFLTLQDLQGDNIKERHRDIFRNKIDLLIIDETHFGARAPKYGEVLRDDGDIRTKKGYSDYVKGSEKEEAATAELIKKLNVDITLHLSGTPYNILMGDEFADEDIIASCQFADIMKAQEDWDREHLDYSSDDESCEEWQNPYFGFPQMIRFAFNPSQSARKKLAELKEEGRSYSLSALFQPKSIKKDGGGLHKQFVNEAEVLDLLMVIDGKKDDDELFGFLDYDRLKDGQMLRHMVMVLPYCASCDAMEALINAHRTRFKNLCDYKILNISGIDNPDKFKSIDSITRKIAEYEAAGRKTITLTVNRMLTGSTVPQWDTMIYLKDTSSAQEYDQAIFRLQNQYITESTSANGSVAKNNMKPQTLLVDFDPDRMFAMQEERSYACCMYKNASDNEARKRHIAQELQYSPIIAVNKNRIVQVTAANLMDRVSRYRRDRGIKDEALDIPVDLKMWDDPRIREIIEKENEIDSGKGFNIPAYEGDDGSGDYDTPDTPDTPGGQPADEEEEQGGVTPPQPREQEEENIFKRKIQSYYVRILLYSYITKDSVMSLGGILNGIDSGENRRISHNIGLYKNYLAVVYNYLSSNCPRILQKLDYKIQHLSNLSHDDSMTTEEKTATAVRKFGKLGDAVVITPSNICDDMVNLFPDDFIRGLQTAGGRVLDIAGVAGEFAGALQKRMLASGLDRTFVNNAIYTVPKSSLCYELIRKMYEMLGLNIANIATEFNAFDLLKVKDDDGNIDYGRISDILKQDKPFNEINITDQPAAGGRKVEFSAVIGNPPYQEADGGAQASAKPIYNNFVEISEEVKSDYVALITPARWMTGGKGLDNFRKKMIHDKHVTKLHDFTSSSDCFNNVEIKGGVCYFLWERDRQDECNVITHHKNVINRSKRYLAEDGEDIFIRYASLVTIKEKVWTRHAEEDSFSKYISAAKHYGLRNDFFKDPSKYGYPPVSDMPIDNGYRILGLNEKQQRIIKYIPDDYPLVKTVGLQKYKVFMSESYGSGAIGESTAMPVLALPGELCTETFLQIGPFDTQTEAENVIKYIKTKFFRTLVSIRKITQHATQSVYKYVPMQDFTEGSDIDWNRSVDEIDRILYAKYLLSVDEITFIESMIKPMP